MRVVARADANVGSMKADVVHGAEAQSGGTRLKAVGAGIGIACVCLLLIAIVAFVLAAYAATYAAALYGFAGFGALVLAALVRAWVVARHIAKRKPFLSTMTFTAACAIGVVLVVGVFGFLCVAAFAYFVFSGDAPKRA